MNPTTSINNVPDEILQIIGSHLHHTDYKECRSVSRRWNRLFRPLFFRVCEFHEKNWTAFNKLRRDIQKPRTKTPKFGHYMHHLTIRDRLMSRDTMRELVEECPNIRSVEFIWDDRSCKWTNDRVNIHEGTRAFHEPYYFMRACRSLPLTNLILRDELCAARFIIAKFTMKYFLKILTRFPTLTTLKISANITAVSPSNLDNLHNLVPNLVELHLPAVINAATTGFKSTQSPALSMKKFSLSGDLLFKAAPINKAWLAYIAYKYPNLTDLYLEEYHRDMRMREANVTAGTDGNRTPLKDMLPKLERVTISGQSSETSSVYPSMLRGLEHVNILGRWKFRDDLNEYTRLIDAISPTVTTLSIKLRTLKEYLPLLRQCQHLRRLTVVGRYGSVSEKEPICLQDLLSICPNLEFLRLQDVCLETTVEESSGMQECPLRRLELCRVAMRKTSTFECVNRLCPHVAYLVLDECRWTFSTIMEPARVALSMPNHRFERVEIKDRVSVDYTTDPMESGRDNTESDYEDDFYLFNVRKYDLPMYVGFKQSSKTDDSSRDILSFTPLIAATRRSGVIQLLRINDTDLLNAIECHLDGKNDTNRTNKEARYHDILYEQSMHLDVHSFLTIHCHSVKQLVIDGAGVDLESPNYMRPKNPQKSAVIKKNPYALEWYDRPI